VSQKYSFSDDDFCNTFKHFAVKLELFRHPVDSLNISKEFASHFWSEYKNQNQLVSIT